MAAKSYTFALNCPVWLPGNLQLEKHIGRFVEQNRLKQIWEVRGPKPVLLSSLMGSRLWQHHAGWGWDRENVKRGKFLSFPFLKGLEQTGPFLRTGNS